MHSEIQELKDRIEKVLSEIRPNLQTDGGDVELVGVERNVISLRLKGACCNCPMSNMTMQWGIVDIIKKNIPEIVEVKLVR